VKPVEERKAMIEKRHPHLSTSAQCRLLGITRSTLYYKPVGEDGENLALMRLLDEQYLNTPFYGVRKLQAWLRHKGHVVNRKRLRRLMGLIGWQTIYRAPRTTIPQKGDYVHPYLLRGLEVSSCNQVWAMDITYVPMKQGFMYLCAVIDLYSRYVVGWGLSNTMSAEWCTGVLEEAMDRHGVPAIVNTDQGSQFTSQTFQGLLKDRNVQPSMDGKGRAIDNIFIERLWRTVKYEHLYLHVYEDGVGLFQGMQRYFDLYNYERPHQSLKDYRPIDFYEYAENKKPLPGAATDRTTTFATTESLVGCTGNVVIRSAAVNKLNLHLNLS